MLLGLAVVLFLGCSMTVPAIAVGTAVSTTPATAAAAPAVKSIAVPNALNTPYLQNVLGKFASVLVGVSGSIGLLVFVWGGVSMIASNGDAAKVKKARDMMVWTAVGLAIIFGSEALVRAVFNVLLQGSVS